MDMESQIIQRRYFPGVDYVKFLMALSVVAIHVNSAQCVGSHWPDAVEWLIRLAVPYFFICSGFFLGSKLNGVTSVASRKKIVYHRAAHIGRIFMCWILIYLPITIYIDVCNDSSLTHDIVTYFGRLFLSGESEYAYPLWFLYSMSIVLVIYAVMLRVRHVDKILFILFTLITGVNTLISTGMSGDTAFTKWFYLLSARTLGGGMYIMLGIFLSRMSRCPKVVITYVLIGASILLFIFKLPYWELGGGCALFFLAIRVNRIYGSDTMKWRSMSMWIYYTHMYVIFVLSLYFTTEGVLFRPSVFMLMVSVPVIILAWSLTRLQSVNGFRWLGCLVS